MKKILKFLVALSLAINFSSCADDSSNDDMEVVTDDDTAGEVDDNDDGMDEEETTGPTSESTLWDGPNITFEKLGGADPTLEENQDKITDNVWITRNSEPANGNDGVGPIYNAVEFDSTEDISLLDDPTLGVLWAIGDISEALDLEYGTFWDAIKPKNAVGQNLVMYLIEDDVYLSFELTSWDEGGNGGMGGFSYIRSGEPQ